MDTEQTRQLIIVQGIVVQGHRVASGTACDSPYSAGTISLQTPHFQRLGLDISGYFPGTINVDITPYRHQIIRPQASFEQVKWIESSPPETFSFAPVLIDVGGNHTEGLVYYPHPETKPAHFQDPHVIEILAPRIEGITTGTKLSLFFDREQVSLSKD